MATGPTATGTARNEGLLMRWTELSSGQNGSWLTLPEQTRRACIQVLGTFGGTVTLQGSNDGGVTAFTLHQAHDGEDAAFTAAGGCELMELPEQIRPIAGSGVADVDVYVRLRADRP